MLSEIRLYEVSAGCRGDDLCCAAFEKLRETAGVVEVAVCADYVVLAFSGWVEWCVVVFFDWAVFYVVSEVCVAV